MLRRSLHVLGLWLTLGVTLSAQRTLRYWFDDQYEAQRTLPSTASVGQLSKYDIPTADLSAGLHTLYLQIRGADGLLSPVRSSLFLKAKAPLSSASGREKLHYWIDDIASKGKPISIAPDSEGIVDMDLPLGSVPTGLHTLYLQWEDEGGYVSPVRSFLFVKPHILPSSTGKPTIHYWYDDIRSKHYKLPPLSQESGVFDLTLSTADLKVGLHTLYLQYQAKGGEVAHVRSAIFVKHNTQAGYDKRRLRYWFDDLHATPRLVELPHTESHGYAVGLPTDKLSYGLHTLYMQYEGAGGSPSPVRSALFLKAPSLSDGAGIKSIRYWFDDQTEATRHYDFEHPLVAGSELTLDLDATGLMRGEHTLHAVLVDENGISGDVQSLKFVEERGIPSEVYLRRLSPDPNELVPSKLMEGAIIRFYYRIEDADKKPIAGVKLKVSFAGEEFVSDPSDTEGVVMVEIETSKTTKKREQLLPLGATGTLKFVALSVLQQNLMVIENELMPQSVAVAYPLHPSSFELKLSQGADAEVNTIKGFGIGMASGGDLKLNFAPDGEIKTIKVGSNLKTNAKVDFSFLKHWGGKVDAWAAAYETAKGKANAANALAAVDRLSRGWGALGLQFWLKNYALYGYLHLSGRGDQLAFTEETTSVRAGGSLGFKYSGLEFKPFRVEDWIHQVKMPDISLGGGFAFTYQFPSCSYVGSSSDELIDYRMPHGKFDIKLEDLGGSVGSKFVLRSIEALYEGREDKFIETIFHEFGPKVSLKVDAGVGYDQILSSHSKDIPQEVSASWFVEGKLSLSKMLEKGMGLDVGNRWFPKGTDGHLEGSIGASVKLSNKSSFSGLMLARAIQLGDGDLLEDVMPVGSPTILDINHYISIHSKKEDKLRALWASIEKSQKTEWLQDIQNLKEGYKVSPSIDFAIPLKVDVPLTPWFQVSQKAELGLSYDYGDSFYHVQAKRLVRPLYYDQLQLVLNPSKTLQVGKDMLLSLGKMIGYINKNSAHLEEDIMSALHKGWQVGKEGVKNGWRTIKSWGRQISDVLRGADEFRAMTFADKTELEISYPLDGHVFSSDSQVQLLSLFGGRQVVDRTTAGEELLVIGDIFYIEALDGTTKLKTSKAPFTLHASVGKDDLRFYSLSEDTPLGLYYVLDDEKGGLELVGEVGKDIKETRLGHYVIACKKPNDAVAPVIKATVDWSKGMLSVDIQDASGVDGHRTVVSIDGEPMKLDGQMQSRIRIPLSTDKLKQNSIFVYVYASDLSGNTSTYLEELANSNPSSAKVSVSRLEAKLYPTQTRTVLWLETPAEFLGCPVRIYDASGATHRELVVRETSMKLDVSDLPAGNYWLRVGAETHRFVKQE